VTGIAFSPDGKLLATAGGRRDKIWTLATGEGPLFPVSQVKAVAFSPWPVGRGKEYVTVSTANEPGAQFRYGVSRVTHLAFSATARCLGRLGPDRAALGRDRQIACSGAAGHVLGVAFSGRQAWLPAAATPGEIRSGTLLHGNEPSGGPW
jgi:hypothetical protein